MEIQTPISINVGSIAKRKIISLDIKKTVKDAAKVMVNSDIGAVVVSDSGKLVGIVTERDILRKVTATSRDASSIRLGSIMSSPLVTIEASQGLGEATSLMLEKKIRRLLVVDQGKLIGFLTQRDLQEKVYDVFQALRSI